MNETCQHCHIRTTRYGKLCYRCKYNTKPATLEKIIANKKKIKEKLERKTQQSRCKGMRHRLLKKENRSGNAINRRRDREKIKRKPGRPRERSLSSRSLGSHCEHDRVFDPPHQQQQQTLSGPDELKYPLKSFVQPFLDNLLANPPAIIQPVASLITEKNLEIHSSSQSDKGNECDI